MHKQRKKRKERKKGSDGCPTVKSSWQPHQNITIIEKKGREKKRGTGKEKRGA